MRLVGVLLLVLQASADRTSVLRCFCHRPELLEERGVITSQAHFKVGIYCGSAPAMTINLYRNVTCDDVMNNGTLSTDVGDLVRRIVQTGIREPATDVTSPARDVCGALVTEMKPISETKVRELLCEAVTINETILFDHWVNNTEWNEQELLNDDQRNRLIEKVLDINSRISEAIINNVECYKLNWNEFRLTKIMTATVVRTMFESYQQYQRYISRVLHRQAELLSLGINNTMQNFVALAFEGIGRTLPQERLDVWMKRMRKLTDWFHGRLNAVVEDIVAIRDAMGRVKLEENDQKLGHYILRLPLLREKLLTYHRRPPPFQEAFSMQCGEQVPEGPEMLRLIETLYIYLYINWFQLPPRHPLEFSLLRNVSVEDGKWVLGDQSDVTISVDTSCVQLMVDMIDLPTCPMEDLPQGVVDRHRECRTQLANNVIHRVSYIPVTSYLAYTQRVNINICLLSWIVSNEKSICHDVPTGIVKSVNDTQCLLSSENQCAQVDINDVICSISRSILWLRCPSFYTDSYEASHPPPNDLIVYTSNKGNHKCEPYPQPSRLIGDYKRRLNVAMLKYRRFKIDYLQPLEATMVSVNVLFRVFTLGVYMYFPKLRNVPGRLLVCFQITRLVQIVLCEILYRFANAVDLSTTVQLDGALTLLSCIWLNVFCYGIFNCAHRLTLPDHLDRYQIRLVFRKYALRVLIVWTAASVAVIVLEREGEAFLIHSRVLLFAAICVSVVANFVLLLLVWDLYLRNRASMRELKIISWKFGSKRRLAYMAVKTCILSGLGVLVRIGFQQVEGLAQAIYYLHLVGMLQGPALFVLFICNDTALPLLRDRLLRWWNPDGNSPGQELGSAAWRNQERRNRIAEAAMANTAV